MAKNHKKAVKKLAAQFRSDDGVESVQAHRISGYEDPNGIGSDGHTPDIFVKYSNGREKIVEVDTKGYVDEGQKETFERSADAKPHVRSFEYYYTSDV